MGEAWRFSAIATRKSEVTETSVVDWVHDQRAAEKKAKEAEKKAKKTEAESSRATGEV